MKRHRFVIAQVAAEARVRQSAEAFDLLLDASLPRPPGITARVCWVAADMRGKTLAARDQCVAPRPPAPEEPL